MIVLNRALFVAIAVFTATYGLEVTQQKFTVRSKRQLCNCIAIPASQFQCSCSSPIVGGSLLQQLELQKQLQLLQGISQCTCAPAPLLTTVVQPAPQYTCQCLQPQPLPPVITTPIPPVIIPEVVPVVPPAPEVVPTPAPEPPTPEVVPPVPEVVPTPPPTTVPVPTPVPAVPVVPYPIYPRYRPGCACVVIKISSVPQYECDCLPPAEYYPAYQPSYLPGYYPPNGIDPALPSAVVPPVSTTAPIIPPFADAPSPAADLAPVVPCLYYVTETCVCPPNYAQCGDNMCCLQTTRYSSQKTVREEAKQLSDDDRVVTSGMDKEPTTMQLFMNVLNRLKTNIQKAANDMEQQHS